MKKRIEFTFEELNAILDTLDKSMTTAGSWRFTNSFRNEIKNKIYKIVMSPTIVVKLKRESSTEEES
jgi:hypothetical protein